MASLTKDNRIVWNETTNGQPRKQRKITLGAMPKKAAQAFFVRVERLIGDAAAGYEPDAELREWLATLSKDLRDKLTRAGLIGRGNGIPTALEPFIAAFIAANGGGVSVSTNNHYRQAQDRALEYFGKTKDIKSFTVGDAMGFSNWLRQEAPKGAGLGENTARDRCKNLRTMFSWAVKCEAIGKNSFSDKGIPTTSLPAEAGSVHLLPVADSVAVLEACKANKDYELAAMFALCRWGGLRVGETRLLTWGHVDFEKGRLTVLSPKTAGKGKDSRVLPLFPELARALAELQSHAPEGQPLLCPYYASKTDEWSYTSVKAAIKRAGVANYPRPWHNLRVTRITELVEIYPAHVVNAWVGNTEAVSVASYRKVTDKHFTTATKAENQAEQAPKTGWNGVEHLSAGNEKALENKGLSVVSRSLGNREMHPTGVEPTTMPHDETSHLLDSAHDGRHEIGQSMTLNDPERALIVELVAAWASLPAQARARVAGVAREVLAESVRTL